MPNIVESADAAASIATAYTLGIGQTARGTINVNGDHDWFEIDLVAGQTYTFAMTGTGTNNVLDTYLRLMSSDGSTVLAFNDNGLQGNNSVFTFTASSTGSYFLDASAFTATEAGHQYGISVTAGTRASFDTDMGAGVIDTDYSWSATPGTGANVTYAFRMTDSGDEAGFSQLTAAEISAVQSILAMYSEVCGITFTQVNPGGYSDNATILFQNYFSTTDGAGAYAYYPGSTASTSRSGDVYLNTNSVSTTSLPVGGYSYFAIMHELGHALGLSHPGLYNAGPGQSITYANNAQFTQDTQMYSVMSYFDESFTGASNYASYADALMLLDIQALQNIYGANTATRSGNTVYGFNSNAGGVYNFVTNTTPALCIWDGGGSDTIDLSGYSMMQVVNLNDGTFSNIGGGTNNVSIAVGANIENVIGGSGNDFFFASAAANTINGGVGSDWVTYSYATHGVTVDLAADTATDTVATDSLVSIECIVGSQYDDVFIPVYGEVNRFNGGTGGNDTVDYRNMSSYVFLDLYDGVVGDGSINDTTYSIENGIGTAFNDFLIGTAANNVLDGGTGGADYFDGFEGTDTLSYALNGRGVTVDLVHGTSNDGVYTDTFQRMENVIGSAFNDHFYNTTGANAFAGGGGNDTYHFNAYLTQGDSISDFNAGDFIYFSGYGAGTLTDLGGGVWRITSYDGGIVETVTLAGVTSLAGQYAFI